MSRFGVGYKENPKDRYKYLKSKLDVQEFLRAKNIWMNEKKRINFYNTVGYLYAPPFGNLINGIDDMTPDVMYKIQQIESEKKFTADQAKRDKKRKKRETEYNTYRSAIGANAFAIIPDYQRSGKPTRIGISRDSYLKALNKTIAQASGIPLNKHNNQVIKDIYGKEINLASTIAGLEFSEAENAGRFNGVKAPLKYNPKRMEPGLRKDPKNVWIRRMARVDIPNINNKYAAYRK